MKAKSAQHMQKPETGYVILFGVIACFVLSGFAALLYQTAWMRQFSLVFGTSELAVAAVLSAYMGGLALGAGVAAKFVHRVKRPVLFYGVLEAGIAISALAVPWLLQLIHGVYVALFGGQPEPVDASGLGQSFFYLGAAFVVLAIPTTFMGATLPLLTRYAVQSDKQIGSRVGLLYATNTLGAVAGTVVAGFILLPTLGLRGTVYVGAAVNILVFVIAALLARKIGPLTQPADAKGSERESNSVAELKLDGHSWQRWILPIMLMSGANSFVYEVLWTRLLGHILGGSVAAFATMLASFLSGIAIGSAIAARFANSKSQSVRLFIAVQVGIAITSILIYQLLPLTIPESTGLGGNVILAMIVLLPATLCIGATFPLAVRILARDQHHAASASAGVYSWNTVGAIAGATIAAFFLIPILKYEGAIKAAVLINFALAVATAALVGKPTLGRHYQPVVAVGLMVLAAATVFYRPKMPDAMLRTSPLFADTDGEIIFYEVGRSATVIVIEDNGHFYIRTNGLPESAASVRGAPPERRSQQLLSAMPVIARPDTENMLIIGLGGAVALEGVPSSVANVDVVELEPQVVAANQFIGDSREINPLIEPRFNITINDARSALTLTDKKYDVIVSQPSHPWTAGASHLYTREFMALAEQHLTDDGVFLQWMNSSFVDEFLLRSLSATLLDVFPHVRMYQTHPGVLFFLGSNQPLEVEAGIAITGRPLKDDVLGYLEKGIGSAEDLLASLAMDQTNIEAFAAEATLITDNNNYMATMSAKAMDEERTLFGEPLHQLISPFDPLLSDSRPDSYQTNAPALNYVYIGRRLDMAGMRRRALDLAESLLSDRDPQGLVLIGLGLQQQGELQESQENLLKALAANPEDQQARYALLQPWFDNIVRGGEAPEYAREELLNLEGSAADTINGLLLLQKGDMYELARLDAKLAAVLPTDLWYATSVKLRADWRIRVTSPEYQPRFATEAMHLLDSALAMALDTQMFVLRVKAAVIVGDIDAAAATARGMTTLVEAQFELSQSQGDSPNNNVIQAKSYQLRELDDLLNSIPVEKQASVPEIADIRASIAGLLSELD